MDLNHTKKILIIRLSSIGDIVLTTPIVRCLRQQTGVCIHYVCKSAYKSILVSNPYIDKVYSFQKDLSEIIVQLKTERYDAIVDLHKNLRSMRIARQLGISRFTFPKLNIEKWLVVNLKINRLPNVHIVERYFEAVQFANIQNDGAGLDYFLPPDVQNPLPPETNWQPQSYITFAIGAAHATKRLPLSQIRSIIELIDYPIVLIGGPSEAETGTTLAKAYPQQIYNLCGKANLHQSAYCIQNSKALITHDTGMMHIAAAFQQKIVSVWGNTIPEFGMYPYYKKNVSKGKIIEIKGLSCRPCSKIGHQQCPKRHFDCMQKINPLDVKAALDTLMSK